MLPGGEDGEQRRANLSPLSSLADQFWRTRDPHPILAARTREIDRFLVEQAEPILTPALGEEWALAAAGGYGRRELFPFSDVDLCFLFDSEPDKTRLREPLAALLRQLWDAGLRISHSVRTTAECLRVHESNTELHISLLDLRLLGGNPAVFRRLERGLPEFYQRHSATLMRGLSALARTRHHRFNGTVYHLEPNIKEAPGGLRDAHLLVWLTQLAPLQEALRASAATLGPALDFLFAVRCALHFRAGRDQNLLGFDAQDDLAAALPPSPEDPARWMRRYYQHARDVFQKVQRALEYAEAHDPSLLRQFRDWRSRLSTSEYTISGERLFLRNPHETVASVAAVFRLFTFVARHGIPLAWDAQRRVQAEASRLCALIDEHPPQWPLWRELLRQPHTALALHAMQEVGLLPLLLPEWGAIDSLVIRDFYHRYTVDEHTLATITTIDDLAGRRPSTPARYQELLAEEDDPALLRLALLLHDLGKGTEPDDHVAGSLTAAAGVAARMRLGAREQDTVNFLIRHHLDLSLIMNGRDLDDPATARFLTSRIATPERLRQLTLLTFADINAVNPTAMSTWRMEQLWRVYTAGQQQLTRELVTDRIHNAADLFPGEPIDRPRLARFLDGLPSRYLNTHAPAEIRRHFALDEQRAPDDVAIEIERSADAYRVTVMAPDRPGLFASLCGALASFGFNIVRGEAFANQAGLAVDQIYFADPLRTLELNPGELASLERIVADVVRGSTDVAALLAKRKRPLRPSRGARIAPSIRFNNEASDYATLIDFVAEDRPGLLYQLASTLSGAGCNIELVLIDTEAHKAIDVFYVTRHGKKLDESVQQALVQGLARAAEP